MKFEQFAARFEFKRPNKDGFLVVCPAHSDSRKSPSLSIGRAKDGGVVLHCFAGCTSEQVVGTLGLKMSDLFADSEAKAFRVPPPRKEDGPAVPDVKPTIEKIYPYHDALGNEVYQALRLKPKSFRQRHKDQAGNWVWTMDGVTRVLFNLPNVLKAQQVIVCEGEKDSQSLEAIGFTSTCNVGGAGKWLDGYSESLKGKDVVICGDNDEPGQKHVQLVFESIAKHAKTVKIIKLPERVKDASDYIATFKSGLEAKAAFDDLISAAYPHVNGIKLPLYTIGELESDYRRFVRTLAQGSFSLGKWVPSLGRIRNLVPGELVVIIGDTGVGKTAIAMSLAKAAQPLPTIVFELELPKEMMFERFTSMATRMRGEDVEQAYITSEESIAEGLGKAYPSLLICPESRLTVPQIENYIMSADLKLGERPKVIILDYVQLVQALNSTRREKISDIIEGLKVLAKATQTIIIVTSQVSRPPTKSGEAQDDWEPHLHSAKESGSIEASCGLLLGIWRDNEDNALNIRVLKSTKGGAGMLVKCNFDGSKMIITERSKISDTDMPPATTPYRDDY